MYWLPLSLHRVGHQNAKRRKKVHETTTFLLVPLPNIHRFKECFSLTDLVSILHCNLSLIACYLTLVFHKLVRQHMQRMVGFLVTTLLQIYKGILQWNTYEDRLAFDRIMAVSLRSHFLAHPVRTNRAPICLVRHFQFSNYEFLQLKWLT